MKRIIIFNSSGGGGHISVTNALKQFLEHDYQVKIVEVFLTVLAPIDIINTLSQGKMHAEALYNFFIKKKWNSCVNTLLLKGCVWYLKSVRRQIKKLLGCYFDEQKPDIIISAIPFINDLILEVAREKGLYFILIPTDLDIRTFIYQIKRPNYDKFTIALPFNDKKTIDLLNTAEISEKNYRITGFVVRPDFFEVKDTKQIRTEHAISEQKPVILIVFGAVGSQELYTFTKTLLRATQPMHLLMCTGRHAYLQEKIDELVFPEHISRTSIGFTPRISDLMAASDFIITKSGTVTVVESFYMNLPLILDGTSEVLKWEQYNHEFIEKQGYGISLKERVLLPELVDDLLKSGSELMSFKEHLKKLDKKNGGLEIKNLLDEILSNV